MAPDEPLRIIHCFRSPIGGIFRHVRDLAEQHAAAGHEVGIVCDSTTGGAHEDKLFAQISPFLALGLTRLPIKRSISPKDLSSLRDSYKTIKSLKPDVLHGHGAKGGVIARSIGSLLRVNRYCVSRVYSPHGGSLHFSPGTLSGQAVFAAERALERLTDTVLFVCDYERKVYEQKIGKPRCHAQMIYNGIAEKDLVPVETVPQPVDFLYVGMLRDLKGPDVFIRAFLKAEQIAGRKLSGLIIGDGPDRDKYEAMRHELGVADRLGLLAAMPVREAFAKSEIVVVPSRAEAMPYIVMEALGAGRGVIASRVGGIPEVLGSDSAALVPPGDEDALARVMAQTLSDPNWRQKTMPSAETLHARFSSPVMAQGILDEYKNSLSRLRRPS